MLVNFPPSVNERPGTRGLSRGFAFFSPRVSGWPVAS